MIRRKTQRPPSEEQKQRLFLRLREGMFAMQRRGEDFPAFIVPRVLKYAGKKVKAHPSVIEEVVMDLGAVLGHEFSRLEVYEAMEDEGVKVPHYLILSATIKEGRPDGVSFEEFAASAKKHGAFSRQYLEEAYASGAKVFASTSAIAGSEAS